MLPHAKRTGLRAARQILVNRSSNVVTELCTAQSRFTKNSPRRKVQGVPELHSLHEGLFPRVGIPLNKDQTLLQLQSGYVKMITINNEKFLNRMDEGLLQLFYDKMKVWNYSPRTKFILLKGAGAGFFSAGLEPRSLQNYLEKGKNMEAANLLRDTFKMAYFVANCETPIATIQNGVMMGAGATIGIHGNYALVTPGAAFATPEVSYGYLPDCGNTFNLSLIDAKYPGAGTFIGITGSIIRSTDLLCTGLGTHYISSTGAAVEIIKLFQELNPNKLTEEVVDRTVRYVVEDNRRPLSFSQDCYAMKKAFHGIKTFDELMNNLHNMASDSYEDRECRIFARKTLTKFSQMSPTALKVTHRAMVLAQGKDMQACMRNEYRAAVRLMNRSPDYRKGIRSVLYDEPVTSWEPAISDTELDEYFSPLTFEDDKTCDLQFPEEVFGGEQILLQYERFKSQ